MKKPKNILITGASSGLGMALAIGYAKQGVHLYLTGRSHKRLLDVKKICVHKGATADEKVIDLTDAKKFSAWVDTIYASGGKIDLVIANAGISAGTEGGAESVQQVQKIFATNIDGVINTIHPVIDYMVQEKKGQVAIISSLAGYRGLPSSPAYSASKAAVKIYGEGLRGSMANKGIGVTVVTPGYIRTPMTDVNNFKMPLLMDATRAARIIIRKLSHNPARIAFPFGLYFVVWLLSVFPPCCTDWLLMMLPGKRGMDG
jgi:short-subunit dehydrogenase